jgi:hypothetical protein
LNTKKATSILLVEIIKNLRLETGAFSIIESKLCVKWSKKVWIGIEFISIVAYNS